MLVKLDSTRQKSPAIAHYRQTVRLHDPCTGRIWNDWKAMTMTIPNNSSAKRTSVRSLLGARPSPACTSSNSLSPTLDWPQRSPRPRSPTAWPQRSCPRSRTGAESNPGAFVAFKRVNDAARTSHTSRCLVKVNFRTPPASTSRSTIFAVRPKAWITRRLLQCT